MLDSAATTKDLFTGVPLLSAGWSLSLGEDGTSFEDASSTFIFTDTLNKAHSDIPPPSRAGWVFYHDFKYMAYAPYYDFLIAPSIRIDEPIQYPSG